VSAKNACGPHWSSDWLHCLGPEKQKLYLDSLTADEMQELLEMWTPWAHPAQRAPAGHDWRIWLFLGGRGAGKTRAGAEWVRDGVYHRRAGRIALLAPTLADAREVMIDGVSGLIPIAPDDERPVYEVSRRRLVWPNGAVAHVFSAEDPDSLRGPQFDAAWCDEFAAWPHADHMLAMLEFGLRLGACPRAVITTTPRPTSALRTLMARGDVTVTTATTADNAAHLAPGFLAALHRIYGGTRLAAQELDGRVLDAVSSLWRFEDVERARDDTPPVRFDRIVVGLDPAVTSGPNADACGIIVVGRVGDTAWVLEDATCQGVKPLEWAARAVRCAQRWNAPIVAESNQGGEMVREMLRIADPHVPVLLCHAQVSKRLRAEPVAALYEQGRVKHAGGLRALEDEMLAFGGGGSPDRVDALVWAVSHVMLTGIAGPRVRMV